MAKTPGFAVTGPSLRVDNNSTLRMPLKVQHDRLSAIRHASFQDAHALWLLVRSLSRQSRFLRLSPAEEQMTASDFAAKLADDLGARHVLTLITERERKVVGYLRAQLDTSGQNAQRVSLGVLAAFQDLGLGGLLMARLEAWSSTHGATRVELTVMLDNVRARSMYERRGYCPVGESTCTLYGTDETVRQVHLSKPLL